MQINMTRITTHSLHETIAPFPTKENPVVTCHAETRGSLFHERTFTQKKFIDARDRRTDVSDTVITLIM